MLQVISRFLLFLLAATALGLGVWGFLITPAEPVTPDIKPAPFTGLWDALYQSLQLFVLGFEKQGAVVWQLQVARFLAPAATLIAAAVLVIDRFWLGFRLRWIRLRGGHRIVCGLGRKGAELARAAQVGTGEMIAVRGVVVIEKNPDHPQLEAIRALRIPVVVGDASIPVVLAKAGIGRSREVMITCGRDDENIQVAIASMDPQLRSSKGRDLRLAPHLEAEGARKLLWNTFVQKQRDERGLERVELSDYCHQTRAARKLFAKFPLGHGKLHPTSERFPLLVLFGFDRMGEAVLLHALRLAHYPNGEQLRVHIFDRQASVLWSRFKGKHPNFGRSELASIAKIWVHDGDVLGETALDRVRTAVLTENADVTLVVALNTEDESLALLERLPLEVRERQCPVRVRIHRSSGISSLIDDGGQAHQEEPALDAPRPLKLTTFGLVEESATSWDTVPFDREKFAEKIHSNYLELMERLREQGKLTDPPGPAERAWGDLPEAWREPNRYAADFAPFLFRSLGRVVVHGADSDAPVRVKYPNEKSLLVAGQMEHRRWYAERYLAGWSLPTEQAQKEDPEGRGGRRDHLLLHPSMKPWSEISDVEQAKDIEQVRMYIEILYSLGCVLELP